MSEPITHDVLAKAVAGTAAGFRAVTRLEPLGGPNDKLFPPTFGDSVFVPTPTGEHRDERRRTKYALEWRRVDGASKLCVVLDSVPSQANRMEGALLAAYERGELKFPFVRVDFTTHTHEDPAQDLSTLCGDGYITSLEAPHRLADALLRDSLFDNKPFRMSDPGRRFVEASPSNATPLFDLCPASLVFGVWDSTGLRGSSPASKYQRVIVSEVIGVGVELGTKTKSRIDPAGIEKTEIYEAANQDEVWTYDQSAAKKKDNKPVLFKRGGEKAGTPAVINHGNVTPSVEPEAGGVTLDYAEQVTVLSFPALRKLRFASDPTGKRLDDAKRRQAEEAARTALAALGLCAIVFQRDDGYDLRSRCALRATAPLRFELLANDGGAPRPFTLDRAGAGALLVAAAATAAEAGMAWRDAPLDLQPAAKLVGLIRKSRALSVVAGDDT